MTSCGCDITAETSEQRRILILALVLNATMFVVGIIAGIIGESTGLIADSLDMLTDAFAYAIGLVAIGRTAMFKARAATLTGNVLVVLGLVVLLDVARRGIFGASPQSSMMLTIAAMSLVVNSWVLHLLSRYQEKEVHLRATWICTRADVIANISVIVSALLIYLTGWRYIDLIIGGAIGLYVVRSAREILRAAESAASA